jgi:hypothetical protein
MPWHPAQTPRFCLCSAIGTQVPNIPSCWLVSAPWRRNAGICYCSQVDLFCLTSSSSSPQQPFFAPPPPVLEYTHYIAHAHRTLNIEELHPRDEKACCCLPQPPFAQARRPHFPRRTPPTEPSPHRRNGRLCSLSTRTIAAPKSLNFFDSNILAPTILCPPGTVSACRVLGQCELLIRELRSLSRPRPAGCCQDGKRDAANKKVHSTSILRAAPSLPVLFGTCRLEHGTRLRQSASGFPANSGNTFASSDVTLFRHHQSSRLSHSHISLALLLDLDPMTCSLQSSFTP